MRTNTFILAMVIVLGVAACAVEGERPDWDSGGDHKRDLAKLAPLGRAVTDSVNAGKGDHTDWRYIKVPEKGTLEVKVSVDNPRVAGTILFLDALGQPLGRARVNGKDLVYAFEEDVDEGKYFVQVQTQKYETVYTVASKFEPEPPPPPPPVAAAPKKRKKRVYKKKAKATPTAPKEEAAQAGTIVVYGKILNKIPWGNENKKTRITFNRGASQGIRAGAVVEITGGPTMKVKEVYEESSVGIAKVKPATINAGTKVKITSKTK